MTEHLTKYEAASRQLATAIRLFFGDGDSISVATLTGAAVEILRRIGKPLGLIALIHDSDMIKEEFRKEYISHIRKHINFFKHAGRDLAASLSYDGEGVKFSLLEAAVLHCQIGARTKSPQMREAVIFNLWFASAHPEYLLDKTKHAEAIKDFKLPLEDLAKKDVWRVALGIASL